MRAFLCHTHRDADFVTAVAAHLRRKLEGGVFLYEESRHADFVADIDLEIGRCNVMVVFASDPLSEWQKTEINNYQALILDRNPTHALVVCLLRTTTMPDIGLNLKHTAKRVTVEKPLLSKAAETAQEIAQKIAELRLAQMGDGLPANPHLFSYEKDIIAYFAECEKNQGKPLPAALKEMQQQGCPPQWPRVPRWHRPGQKCVETEGMVVAAALSKYHAPRCEAGEIRGCMMMDGPCFPEAVRRDPQSLYYPTDGASLKVGILVCGGIAPGINAVIDGIVQRHELYAKEGGYRDNLRIYGLRNGFLAFSDTGMSAAERELNSVVTGSYATEGGSFLGTSRDEELSNAATRADRLQTVVNQLRTNGYDIVYVIGGDGSMKAAHALWTEAERECKANGRPRRPISVVAVPKTMDNDILWVWQAFGFMSAVEKAREIIAIIGTEVQSNPRLYVVQLFGSDSGFVVSHAVLASKANLCDAALIPEIDFTMDKLAEHMRDKIRTRSKLKSPGNPWSTWPGGLVVMAETAIPTDALKYIDDKKIGLSDDEKTAIRGYFEMRKNNQRIQGQTSEHLRSAGLKIVSKRLSQLLQETNDHEDTRDSADTVKWGALRVFTNEPRHLLRAIPPSCTDIIFGNRLGTLAVDNAMAGYTDFMISQWLTEYVLVPLQLVVLGRKRIPKTGMFWKSVVAKTGQPESMK